jgi:hypothetical protein
MTALGIPTPDHSSSGVGYTFGNRFTCNSALELTQVVKYRFTGAPLPNEVRLYHNTGGNLVFNAGPGTLTWTGTTPGWYTLDLAANGIAVPSLVPGDDYTLSYYGENSGFLQGWNDGAADPIPAVTFVGGRFDGGNVDHPTSAPGSAKYDIDFNANVAGSGGSDGSTLTGDPALTGDLEAWLSATSANLHQTDGLPWLTKADTADIRTKVTNGFNLAGGLQALSDSLAHTIQMASDWLASGSTTIFTDLKNRILGASGGGGSAFYGPDGTQVADGVEQLLARPAATAASNPAPGTFPGTGWTLTDETDFTLCIAYDQPADLYVITCDETTIAPKPEEACGVTRYSHLLWHALLNGDFLQERHFGDFAKLHVADGGRRMPGLYVKIYAGGNGHIQAWQYAP